jgi:hypothetical protein
MKQEPNKKECKHDKGTGLYLGKEYCLKCDKNITGLIKQEPTLIYEKHLDKT